MTSVKVLLCIFMAEEAVIGVHADELHRHGVIGLTVATPDATRPEDPRTNPPTVAKVAVGGAAESADIRAGDVLREIDGATIRSSSDFAIRVARHLAGESVTLLLSRGGQQLSKSVILRSRPYENSPDADLLYSSVNVGGARRRVIITRPKSPGRYPAVMLIGGLGCYSLDGELTRPTGYGPILSAFAQHGFVTMRVEKTGEGDSEGPACTDSKATVDVEADGYLAGLRLLKQYDFVNPEQVFIFAHSLGPLIGSLVVTRESVRGLVAAETIGRSWFEYGLENVRRQSALLGEPLDQVDAEVQSHAECAYQFSVLHKTAEEVTKLGEQCDAMIRSYEGMPETYMHQIGDLSLGKQWKQVDIPVLVIYGTADPATSADECRYLAELINSFHPGRASYVEIEGMGHDFGRYNSQAEFLKRQVVSSTHPFDAELASVVLKWLDRIRNNGNP